MYNVGIFSLNKERTVLPIYATKYSACFDLIFCPSEGVVTVDSYDSRNNNGINHIIADSLVILPGARVLIPTAMIFDLSNIVSASLWKATRPLSVPIDAEETFLSESGYSSQKGDIYSMRVYPRSGLSLKTGLGLINSVGIIDGDYTKQLYIPMINHSEKEVIVSVGDRVAQAEILKNGAAIRTQFHWISERPVEVGGRTGGFGSTGGNFSSVPIK
jgi:dUTP pyrophosphatase